MFNQSGQHVKNQFNLGTDDPDIEAFLYLKDLAKNGRIRISLHLRDSKDIRAVRIEYSTADFNIGSGESLAAAVKDLRAKFANTEERRANANR